MTNKKCEICNKHEAKFKIKNTLDGSILLICEWCEEDHFELIEPLNPENQEPQEKQEHEDPEETEKPKLGRLHLVENPRTEKVCRECKVVCEKGMPRYNQSTHSIPFPTPSVVCIKCGDQGVKEKGWEVAPKK